MLHLIKKLLNYEKEPFNFKYFVIEFYLFKCPTIVCILHNKFAKLSINTQKQPLLKCNLPNNNLNINSLSNQNQSYVAQNVSLSQPSSPQALVVGSSNALWIEAKEILLNGGFEVKFGGQLTTTICP